MGHLNNTNCSLSRGAFTGVRNLAAATICAWIRSDNDQNNSFFCVGTNSLGSQARIGMMRNGSFELVVRGRAPDGSQNTTNSTLGIPTSGTRYHVACVVNVAGDVQQIYVNGQLDISAAAAFTPTAFDNTDCGGAALMANPDGTSDESDGWGEDYRIYNRVLSAAEIETIFNCRGHDGIWFGLLNRWRVIEGAPGVAITVANSVKDLGNNGNHMSPNVGSGGPQWDYSYISGKRRFR